MPMRSKRIHEARILIKAVDKSYPTESQMKGLHRAAAILRSIATEFPAESVRSKVLLEAARKQEFRAGFQRATR